MIARPESSNIAMMGAHFASQLNVTLIYPCGCELKVWQFLIELAMTLEEGQTRYQCPTHHQVIKSDPIERQTAIWFMTMLNSHRANELKAFIER